MTAIKEMLIKSLDKKKSKDGSPLIPILFIVLFLGIILLNLFEDRSKEEKAFFEIVFVLLLAVIAHTLAIQTQKPTVLVLLLFGILLSTNSIGLIWGLLPDIKPIPSLPPEIFPNIDIVNTFATLGLIILMFKVGIHENIEEVVKKENLIVAFLGVIVPFVGGFMYAYITGTSMIYALLLGVILTATSVGITVSVLEELNAITTPFAKTLIGAAVIDDIIGLVLLSLITKLPAGINGNLIPEMTYFFVNGIVFVIGAVMLMNRIIENVIDKNSFTDQTFLIVLTVILLYSYVAEQIGLSTIVGAFIAGILLTKSKYVREIEIRVRGLAAMFTPVFFISLGLIVDINAIIIFWEPIILISAIAIATKIIGCTAGSLLVKKDLKESLAIGLGMVPRGEVALIIALFAVKIGMMNISQYSIISAMVIITMLLTPIGLNFLLPQIIQKYSEKKSEKYENIRYLS